jgi:tetratricopeptide (TPR) repeat protein
MFITLDLGYSLFLNDVSLEITPFMLPTIVLLSIWGGYGLSSLLTKFKRKYKNNHVDIFIIALIVLIGVACNIDISDKSENLIAYDYGMNVLKSVEDDAVIFAQGDNVVFPLSYLLYVEKAKPAVTLIEQTGLISHEFYGQDFVWLEEEDHVRRQYQREYDMIRQGKPVYYTSKGDLEFPGYKLVQKGLVYKVVGENDSFYDDDIWDSYDYRQIQNSTIYLDFMSNQVKAIYYIRLAEHYIDADKDLAAIILLDALNVLPDNKDILYDLGGILLSQKRADEAIEVYNKILKGEPLNPKVLNNIGFAYMLKEEYEKGRNYYLVALKQDPYYIRARFNLANVLGQEGRYVEALQHYSLIIQATPDHPVPYLNMGQIYYKMGDFNRAKVEREHYLTLEPQSTFRVE